MSDILELEPDESEMHFLYDHLAGPIWIPGGMVCHVPECPRTDKLSTLRAFVRHWKFIHDRTITLYVCAHLDCLEVPVFKAKNELHRHIQYKHKLSVEEARTLAATYPTQEEVNFGFVDPRENLPPWRLSLTLEMARQTDRYVATNRLVLFPISMERVLNLTTLFAEMSLWPSTLMVMSQERSIATVSNWK